MQAKTPWIRTGDFFFKYRDIVFPLILLSLFFGFPAAHRYGGSHGAEIAKDVVAVAIAFAGLGLRAAVIGFAYIKRGGLNKQVYAERLVTEGFFAACRNPLYVGNMLIYSGVFLMHGNPYVVVLGIAGYFLIYQSIIAAEEYFLRGTFGAAYEDYCREVPRWHLRWRRLREATRGMRFQPRRVIAKDYTTIANTCMALILAALLESRDALPDAEFTRVLAYDLALILAVLVVMGTISFAKKRGMLQA